ncbi:hypothetical protein AUEXF2481DRAFT_71182 [Aureobasidium subglaciale EXF-2481]|uniref:Endoplasmic reticulum junction formation protein lunapark n=1 Tax=Aureobasidium subglaciale (strain EXF-2481) TaxID=1043005 RepID=A0A074Y3K7_AURSE|nr:uncharacterized protein AUEXF2481DRAFT_71182 [Aureobasidium subglaciale EXF-2481]KAI5196310.1 hypothetical protein E4T38_08556 [Aureobasidium subglaciale]KAI5215127.1 hypothetical protein E4T40_08569 [Aureobasidium subglaciale]KAI5218324.1 hypothetical protein E4T41_08422 [Aureobasidium subglaciale]KAI5256039.1 hypothetical protein E4T46_08457 [Aureobasidium subglaciale]KEQ90524.1 hypothetical protein AUEXF2481DRAFT_71182 [Aureobasidium subglaciale EXF-2481]
MVSFWPFKGHDSTSAASFEKLLSSLSSKINKESARNDRLRQRQRRYKVLWTLYTTFAYLLAATILVLVTGLSNCTAIEYTGLAGSPVLIYAVRTALDAYFNYRLASSQTYLNDLNKQRDDAITKLKDATKYNSTQQLLDKYGGGTPTKSPQQKMEQQETPTKNKPQSAPVKRTGLPPPPTANIPGRQLPPSFQPMTPPQQGAQSRPVPTQPQHRQSEPQAEFAPNAFTAPTPRNQNPYASSGPRWYDRILDVVLGDDETLPKNRIVLLCAKCRLVNGQAPPGTRSLEDLGAWRCKECHALNGQESEAKAMIREIAGESKVKEMQEASGAEKSVEKEQTEDEANSDMEQDSEVISAPAESTRSKIRQRKK